MMNLIKYYVILCKSLLNLYYIEYTYKIHNLYGNFAGLNINPFDIFKNGITEPNFGNILNFFINVFSDFKLINKEVILLKNKQANGG